jgi:hypothetical protein
LNIEYKKPSAKGGIEKFCLEEKRGYSLRSFGGEAHSSFQSFDSLGREADFDAVDPFGLQVDLESSSGGNVGVAARVPCLGPSASEFTYSAHRDI